MTLQEASNFFDRLKNESSINSERKVYGRFIYLLGKLNNRSFSKEETQSIEAELDSLTLELSPENRKKYFKRALSRFEKYLKDAFSLIPKAHYTKVGLGLGTSFGILSGIVFLSGFERSLGIALGLTFGLLMGLIIGRSMDAKASKEGRVL